LAALDPNDVARRVAAGESVAVTPEISLAPDELLVDATEHAGYAVAEEGGYTVALDTALTPALVREGLARDLVRAVQDARKAAGLRIEDTIALWVDWPHPEMAGMLGEYGEYVRGETLATYFTGGSAPPEAFTSEATLGGVPLTLGLTVSGTASGATRLVSDEGDEG